MVSRDRAPDQGRSQDFFYRATLCVSAVFVVRRCPSVCPSVRLSVTVVDCIQTAEDIVKLLSGPCTTIVLVFFVPPAPIPNFNWNPFSGGVNYMGWEKFAIFDWIRRLSRKRYEIGSCMVAMGTLIGSGRRRIDPCRFRWPWVTLNPGFPSHCIHSLQVE